MAEFKCYAWVSLLTKDMGSLLMNKMISDGYAVGPLASSGDPYDSGAGGTLLLTMKLTYNVTGKEKKIADVLKELKAHLKDLGASYNMAMVSAADIACTWSAGEHVEPPKKKVKAAIDRLIDEEDEKN